MGHFYRSEIHKSHLRLLNALFRAMLPLTVGGNITWFEPPPFETVTDPSSISRTNKQVIQGSLNEELSCNFSLTADSSIAAVLMKFRDQPAVTFVPNVLLQVEPAFAKHFDAVWVPNKLSLILFNVTDAEEGEYTCEVLTIRRSTRSWIRKIQLLVLDPSQVMVSSITVPQNLIQTTVSAITASEDPRQTTVSSITGSQIDNPAIIIGGVIGAVAALFIAILIGCCLRRRMWSKIRYRDQPHGEKMVMQVKAVDALLKLLAADGINVCDDSQQGDEKMVIQVKAVDAVLEPLAADGINEKVCDDSQQGDSIDSEWVDKVQDVVAVLEPLAADGINGNQSKRDIQGKEEDSSVYREKVCDDSQQGDSIDSEWVDKVQDVVAVLEPLAADGINGNQSKRDIQGKEEDSSVYKKVCDDSQQEDSIDSERVDKVQDVVAVLEPLAADGINGNESKRDIQGKEEDSSVYREKVCDDSKQGDDSGEMDSS